MNVLSGSGLLTLRSWLVAATAVFFLAACATTGSQQGDPSSEGEIVDIGYGTVDAGVEHGSTEVVEGPGASDQIFLTLGEMLMKIPGVRVFEGRGGSVSVRIRGTNSFLGGEEPLWVLDGMPVNSGAGLAGISPNAIESLTVLKDPGETAIFGMRGANGVILVRTRSGG